MKCVEDTIEVDKTKYSLDYRIIDGDVNLPQNSFRTLEFLPHGAKAFFQLLTTCLFPAWCRWVVKTTINQSFPTSFKILFSFNISGCFCIYSSHRTLEYIRDSLEKTLLSNLEQEDRLPFHGLPIVIVFTADSTTNEKDLIELRDLGQHRAKRFEASLIDVFPIIFLLLCVMISMMIGQSISCLKSHLTIDRFLFFYYHFVCSISV